MCAAKCFSCFSTFPQPIPGRLFLQLGLGDTIRQMVRLCREVYPLWRARACHAVNLDLRWMVTLLWVSRQGLSGNSWCFDIHKTMWHVVYKYKTKRSSHYFGFPKSIQIHPNQHAQNHKPSSKSSSHPKNPSVQPILIQSILRNGICSYSLMIPYGATFTVFFQYGLPAIRMAAISKSFGTGMAGRGEGEVNATEKHTKTERDTQKSSKI